ncbi:MAG: GNAT family N-acetyltransferase [Alphaproteobacteria bacterium]|nr:GNAT family N-acetyltransferase [Alphaproteobacteria bacterium]MDX5368829.1 GNAT family N-acetyltransferase [Alphaproteobacteria bacterium]MDX5463557.1 GNAT family N-acetyltransferase [Alphaproteobacteria bacterium]
MRILATSGPLAVRLAVSQAEVEAAQRLRYTVFYEEMAASPSAEMAATRRDFDRYDGFCDHLLVIDEDAATPEGRVVGTYRLLRHEVAKRNGGFYSADEYDLTPLLEKAAHGLSLMELGRSCVARPYRTNATIQLLWRGITGYMFEHGVDVMFGCASLAGTDPDKLALPLSFLHHEFLAPADWRVRALDARYVPMDRMPKEEIDLKSALNCLPPLIKGYLRLGAYIGDGAVVDHQFGTTDVFIILPVDRIPERYYSHFDRDGAAARERG